MLVAMAVYTSERWSQAPNPQVQTFFCWSFYLGWVSTVLFLCAGDRAAHPPAGGAGGPQGWGDPGGEALTLSATPGALSLAAHCSAPRPGYETL